MRTRVLAIVVTATLMLGACGGSGHGETPGGSGGASSDGTVAAGAGFNDADVEFAQSMIPHHEQAIEMAEIALDPAIGASAAITDLAKRITAGQDPEIKQMTGWLTAWGTSTVMDTSGGHQMSEMEGMMSADEMDGLNKARGAEFDKMWATMMIAHHTGAISMAKTVQADGTNADVRALAVHVVAHQQAEIDEMQPLAG